MGASSPAPEERRGSVDLVRGEGGDVLVRLAGRWRLRGPRPDTGALARELGAGDIRRLAFDSEALEEWDTSLLTFLDRIEADCETHGIEIDRDGLPSGVRRLLALAEAVAEKEDARTEEKRPSWLARIGQGTVDALAGGREFLAFIGEATVAAAGLLRGRARFRFSDLFLYIQECGALALPIVTLISFLLGLILAFMGAVQLQQFGAAIYVADLVAVAMAREMGAVMTGVIMAGRTGAAFAAQLGTMKVTEEIDALTTMGIAPMDFLVLPRMIALFLMMPLLCVYADVVGILGGAVVGIFMLDLSPADYFHQTVAALTFTQLSLGIIKSAVFGLLIALSGCLRGMQCGGSASAVGDAATSAVVTSIVFLIVTDGLFAVITNVIGV